MKLKELTIILMFFTGLFMTACSKDDEPKPELTPEYLEATTWNAELTGTQSPIPNPISAHFVMQFLTKKSGKCIPAYGDTDFEGDFTYNITKDMILFNGSLTGYWTVVEQTKTTIILKSFQPNEYSLVLTRILTHE